jgi:hypothetical protein
MAVAKTIFEPVPSGGVPLAPEAMSLEQLRKILDAADAVESWLKACRSYARNLLDAGKVDVNLLGYKLVDGRTSRKWRNEEEARQVLEMALEKAAYITKLVSPAQAEKLLGKQKKILDPLVEKSQGVQMVSLADKREAVSSKAAAAFDAVDC